MADPQPAGVADAQATPGWPAIASRLGPLSNLGPVVALLAAVVFFTTQSDRFLTGENLSLVLQQVMVGGTLAIAQTLLILPAGIGLSLRPGVAVGTLLTTQP